MKHDHLPCNYTHHTLTYWSWLLPTRWLDGYTACPRDLVLHYVSYWWDPVSGRGAASCEWRPGHARPRGWTEAGAGAGDGAAEGRGAPCLATRPPRRTPACPSCTVLCVTGNHTRQFSTFNHRQFANFYSNSKLHCCSPPAQTGLTSLYLSQLLAKVDGWYGDLDPGRVKSYLDRAWEAPPLEMHFLSDLNNQCPAQPALFWPAHGIIMILIELFKDILDSSNVHYHYSAGDPTS